LFEKFHQVVDRPESVKEIRDLILQLAVQGKLVEQDPNDEPASLLLEEIKAEKERLVKAGEIRKEKALPSIESEEVPFQVPPGWEWVHLGCIGEFINGDRGKNYPNKSEYVTEGVPWINAGHINHDGYLKQSAMNFITPDKFKSLRSGKIQHGDLLYCIRGTLGKTAKVFPYCKGAVASSLVIIRAFVTCLNSFLFNYLVSPTGNAQVIRFDNGSAQPNLSANNVRRYLVPLPPLPEQKRIVAKIDELMALCDQLEDQLKRLGTAKLNLGGSALHHLLEAPSEPEFNHHWSFVRSRFDTLFDNPVNIKKLKQAILQLAVQGKLVPQDPSDEPASVLLEKIKAEKERLVKEGKIKKEKPLLPISLENTPYRVPNGWEWVSLAQMADVGTGSTPSTSIAEYYGGTTHWVTSTSTGRPYICETEKKVTKRAIDECRLRLYPKGTLVIALYGQGKTRGQISELSIEATMNQACAAIFLILSGTEHKTYVKYFFLKAYEEIRSLAEGGAQPNLNVGKVKKALIPMPPLPEQKRIVAKVDELMTLCNHLETNTHKLNETNFHLLQSIVHHVGLTN
jgi:type I restriction enzyme S subunit